MSFADTADLAVRLTLDDRFSRQLRGASSSLGRFEGNVKRVGKGFGQFGSGLARVGAVGLTALGGGLTYVAKQAIDFEDAFAGVRKTVTATPAELDSIALAFRKMATEIPVAATELARIGETAGALGIKAKDIDDFTKTVALLSVTTNLSADQAASDLGKVTTILGLTGKGITDFADTLVNLGNQGASTESDIIEVTKRFAAMGKQAGLTTPEILALSSAATSLGAEPEAAGSALSRIFSNMSTEIATASDKGKAFSKITGDSLKVLQRKIRKGDALAVLIDYLKGLKGLNRTQAAKALQATGITNVRDRNAILLMAQNFGFLNDQVAIANKSQGALAKESAKRFDTVASKIRVFRNNVVEAAIVVGEGFAPALGRSAEKLSKFLQQADNRAELKRLGEDIGKFIDGINWQEVLDGIRQVGSLTKTAFDWASKLFGAFNQLPGPIKEATVGFLALDKLSGGLLHGGASNIFGGISETIIRALGSKLPGAAGKLFVQPVFVTNFPVGFGGGVPGAVPGGGKSFGGKALDVASKLLLVGAVAEIADFIHEQIKAPPDIPASQLSWPWGPKNTPTILPELFGGRNGLLGGDPVPVVVKNLTSITNPAIRPPGHDQTRTTGVGLLDQRHGEQGGSALLEAVKQAPPKLDSLHQAVATGATNIHSVVGVKGDAIKSQVAASSIAAVGATNSGTAAIVGAIERNRPIVNVTNVTRTTVVQDRIGPSNGSYGYVPKNIP